MLESCIKKISPQSKYLIITKPPIRKSAYLFLLYQTYFPTTNTPPLPSPLSL